MDNDSRLWLMRLGSPGATPVLRKAPASAPKRKTHALKVLEWSVLAAGAALLARWAH
jgi:hypothetical protein